MVNPMNRITLSVNPLRMLLVNHMHYACFMVKLARLNLISLNTCLIPYRAYLTLISFCTNPRRIYPDWLMSVILRMIIVLS